MSFWRNRPEATDSGKSLTIGVLRCDQYTKKGGNFCVPRNPISAKSRLPAIYRDLLVRGDVCSWYRFIRQSVTYCWAKEKETNSKPLARETTIGRSLNGGTLELDAVMATLKEKQDSLACCWSEAGHTTVRQSLHLLLRIGDSDVDYNMTFKGVLWCSFNSSQIFPAHTTFLKCASRLRLST